MVVTVKTSEVNNIVDTAVFRIADMAGFLWQHMDDAHIIYDPRSGHSQALNDFACEIFDIIADRPCGLSDILAEVEEILEQPLTDDLRQQLRMTVIAFDEMGLIEPVKPE